MFFVTVIDCIDCICILSMHICIQLRSGSSPIKETFD